MAQRRLDADNRTKRQIEDIRLRFGQAAADATASEPKCPECGAVIGYVHAAGCKTDNHPELGQEGYKRRNRP